MTPTLGLIVLGCLAAVFAVGVVVGRLAVAGRQVDRILERELRHRGGQKPGPAPSTQNGDAARLGVPAALLGPPIYPAELRTPAMLGLDAEEAMNRAAKHSAALNDAAQYGLPERLIGRCAKPVDVALGDARTRVPCLLRPGHDGRCS